MKNKKNLFRGAVLLLTVLFFFPIDAKASDINVPKLLGLYTQTNADNSYTVRITFSATFNSTCYIYRKPLGGSYRRIGKVRAAISVTSFTDHNMPSVSDYVYTVREKGMGIYSNRLSDYDHEGLMTIRGRATVTARSGNLNSRIRWRPVKGADGYRIYRRMDRGHFRLIGQVDKNRVTFTDVYSRTFSPVEKKEFLSYGCYLDTSSHIACYTVRATRRSIDFDKISLSPFEKDGYYRLQAPIIIDFKKKGLDRGCLTFTSVPYANLYLVKLIYKDGKKKRYYSYSSLYSTNETYIDSDVPIRKGMDYCVYAYATRNGRTISARSSDFTLKYRNYSVHDILYIGDSITYGSPYKTDINRYIFSYPWRVMELTGSDYYNAAIPGATLAYSNVSTAPFHRFRIIKDVIPRIALGNTPNCPPGLLTPNKKSFSDFDTVILLAGTNDYTDLIPIGDISSDDEGTYCGAMNRALDIISKANDKRIKKGRTPVKIVMPDLIYSDRCNNFTIRQSRFKTKNAIGFTLKDYERARNSVIERHKSQGLKIYRFHTKSFVDQKNCPYSTADNLHMTRYTYEKMGDSLTRFLVEKVWPD